MTNLDQPLVENLASHEKGSFKDWLKHKSPILVILFLTGTLVLAFFWSSIVITIQSGEAGILFKRFSGTKVDKIYGEGLDIFAPWDKLYIYEVRKQIAYHDFMVISNKGLTIHLSLAIRYSPEYDLLGVLHQKIGPDYLNRVILPQIESVMRKQLGDYTAEQIYRNEAGLLTNAILTALDEVGRNYIEVEDIIIRSIALPKQMVDAIEDKLRQEELMKSYEFRIETARKEAERLKQEALGIQNYHSTIGQSLSENVLRHNGIIATQELAKSSNAKVVLIGGGKDGLPIILNTSDSTRINTPITDDTTPPPSSSKPAAKGSSQK